jgi:hypothetical protein
MQKTANDRTIHPTIRTDLGTFITISFGIPSGAEQAAEKLRLLRRNREKRPSAASKAALILLALCGG